MIKKLRHGHTSQNTSGLARRQVGAECTIRQGNDIESTTSARDVSPEKQDKCSGGRDGTQPLLHLCDGDNAEKDDSLDYLSSLDKESFDDLFPACTYGPQPFDGQIHGYKMYHRYRQFCLNTKYATKSGFAIGQFYTTTMCEKCGWTQDQFPSLQRRQILIPASDCKMCKIVAEYGPDNTVKADYTAKLLEEFSYWEIKAKSNRQHRIARIDSKEPY